MDAFLGDMDRERKDDEADVAVDDEGVVLAIPGPAPAPPAAAAMDDAEAVDLTAGLCMPAAADGGTAAAAAAAAATASRILSDLMASKMTGGGEGRRGERAVTS